jgi:16S rRNA (cytidine1402-2'-O)-methyltransferase
MFEGFPPRAAAARRARFAATLQCNATSIWYESPQRIRATLADLATVAPDAQVFVVREYTKLHEQHYWGMPESVAAQIADPPRGEVAFAIAPYRVATVVRDRHEEVSDAIDALLESGQRVGDVAKELAAHGFGDRRQLYAAAAARKAAQKAPQKQQ